MRTGILGNELGDMYLDRYDAINARMTKETGIPCLINYGVTRHGKFHYKEDGFVYKTGRKKPLGHWLKVEWANIEVALRPGRVEDAHMLEQLRWKLLLRLKERLLPELERRGKVLRKEKGRKRFTGYVDGQLYSIGAAASGDKVSYSEVDRTDDGLGVLDVIGRDWTPAEDDKLAAFYINMSSRVARGWDNVSKVTGLLINAIDRSLNALSLENPRLPGYGRPAEVMINGRRYTAWFGSGGMFHSTEDLTKTWPSPMITP
jgi:hypothetical protein